jgi:hypothetical protein
VVLGSWFLVLGSWFLVLGSWCLVLGAWCLVLGAWCLVLGAWCLVLVSCQRSLPQSRIDSQLKQLKLEQAEDRVGGEFLLSFEGFQMNHKSETDDLDRKIAQQLVAGLDGAAGG